jgi:hypothetical protein
MQLTETAPQHPVGKSNDTLQMQNMYKEEHSAEGC